MLPAKLSCKNHTVSAKAYDLITETLETYSEVGTQMRAARETLKDVTNRS